MKLAVGAWLPVIVSVRVALALAPPSSVTVRVASKGRRRGGILAPDHQVRQPAAGLIDLELHMGIEDFRAGWNVDAEKPHADRLVRSTGAVVGKLEVAARTRHAARQAFLSIVVAGRDANVLRWRLRRRTDRNDEKKR